ncbi:hypothetical protein [uncultured Alistipes sp.]|jgi:hypothetical protein|uniref:hypothetical protein n=1 Tax=uncultured Alistipes sp. TaxID=538949 RepID=UPI0025F859E0|nr:hypothetical protein [uncultured Alistipes sp.]
MKNFFIRILFIGTLLCIGSGAGTLARAHENKSADEDTRSAEAFLKEFYVAYCQSIAHSKADPALFDRYLTGNLVAKVKKVAEENGYDLIIKAQDFDPKAIETIIVAHVAENWYAVGYMDFYTQKCVIVPVKLLYADGTYRLDDIATE